MIEILLNHIVYVTSMKKNEFLFLKEDKEASTADIVLVVVKRFYF